MLNFRSIVAGSSGSGKAEEEWPKLGEAQVKPKRHQNVACWEVPTPSKSSLEENSGSFHEKDVAFEELDSLHFPALGKHSNAKLRKREIEHKPSIEEPFSAKRNVKTPKKKKVKRSTPLQVDICEIIQASALKKKQKCGIAALKKSSKIKRKIIGGNLLDSDRPKRHKGKVRPWKPRFLSKTKKIICASRKVRVQRLCYTQDVLKFKENLGVALKLGKVDVDKLVDNLTVLSLEMPPKECDQTPNDSVETIAHKTAKDIIHNKKFRSYCNNIVTHDVKKYASELIITLRKFQDRMHAKDEIKAHAKRRYVCGLNESKKFLLADKVKLLIVATNLEMEEGLPSMAILKQIVSAAEERNVPVVYAGLGENIGYWSLKKAKISVLAVMNYEGAGEAHANLIKSWENGKEEYDKLINKIVGLYFNHRDLSVSETSKTYVEEEIKDAILKKLKE